jgi:GH15 family glucan-1,4-alpha-glucosidase
VGRWIPSPIRDYGLIGDTRTAALVSSTGSIDWMCWPRFDSEPVFGRLIDPERGGWFELTVEGILQAEHWYRDRTATLEARWKTAEGSATLIDGMSRPGDRRVLMRRLSCTGGRVTVHLHFEPRAGLPGTTRRGRLVMRTSPALELQHGTEASLELRQGQSLSVVVSDRKDQVDPADVAQLLDKAEAWWRDWAAGVRSGEPYRDVLVRSLINLRLLTFTPTGAPVAAPTTSLPEEIGGGRNWDYRFSWPRDASVGVSAFLAVGKIDEARGFLDWLVNRACSSEQPLRVLYDLDGNRTRREREVNGVAGYLGSRPVRIGNLAEKQHQLDVYGWVLDAIWNFVDAGEVLDRQGRRVVRNYADFLAANWTRPDAGLWEVRDSPKSYVHSKVWAWLGLDRARRTNAKLGLGQRRSRTWRLARDAIAKDVREHGYDHTLQSYVRAYGSTEMDSALLLLPLTGFDANQARLESTVRTIWAQLEAGGPLLFRYPPGRDGLRGSEGAFVPSSFWLLEALLRLGHIDEGVRIFHEMLALANELLLLPEEMDPVSKAYLGNYPMALSQAGLVHAVLEVQRALGG